MPEVEVELGTHTIKWEYAGYETLAAVVDVKETGVECINVISDTGKGNCGSTTPPGVSVSGFTISAYLKEIGVKSYDEWVKAKGGASGMKRNTMAIMELLNGYVKAIDLGFVVTVLNIIDALDKYVG